MWHCRALPRWGQENTPRSIETPNLNLQTSTCSKDQAWVAVSGFLQKLCTRYRVVPNFPTAKATPLTSKPHETSLPNAWILGLRMKYMMKLWRITVMFFQDPIKKMFSLQSPCDPSCPIITVTLQLSPGWVWSGSLVLQAVIAQSLVRLPGRTRSTSQTMCARRNPKWYKKWLSQPGANTFFFVLIVLPTLARS